MGYTPAIASNFSRNARAAIILPFTFCTIPREFTIQSKNCKVECLASAIILPQLVTPIPPPSHRCEGDRKLVALCNGAFPKQHTSISHAYASLFRTGKCKWGKQTDPNKKASSSKKLLTFTAELYLLCQTTYATYCGNTQSHFRLQQPPKDKTNVDECATPRCAA